MCYTSVDLKVTAELNMADPAAGEIVFNFKRIAKQKCQASIKVCLVTPKKQGLIHQTRWSCSVSASIPR